MKTDFVLIDYENVRVKDLASLSGGSYNIKVFLGAQQAKIPVALARDLQAFGLQAEYIQISGNGSNAVDFHIAYYIGRLAATAPDARFHVVSNDTGFDPLLKHLEGKGIACQRSACLADVASFVRTGAPSEDKVAAVVDNLAKRKSAKPRTEKALRAMIQSLFGNELMAQQLERLIEQLRLRGVIAISDGKIEYAMPA